MSMTVQEGRYHTIRTGDGRLVNGLQGGVGMQFANTDRPKSIGHNARFAAGGRDGTLSMQGTVSRLAPGEEVRVVYGWSEGFWKEQTGRVLGLLSWEPGAVTVIWELFTMSRNQGVATALLRLLAEEAEGGTIEAQVDEDNELAGKYLRGLGFRRTRWWEGGVLVGHSAYAPPNVFAKT